MEQNLPKRKDVPEELTWRLEDIYADRKAWEEDVAKGQALADEIASYEGKVTESAASLLKVLQLYDHCMETLYSFSGYAGMRHDQDTSDPEGQEIMSIAQSSEVKISEKIAFIEPEILSLDEEILKKYMDEEPGLKEYEVTIKEIVRMKDHSLSADMEKLLASAGDMASVPSTAFSMLSNADLKFPSVTDESGQEVQITNGRFVPMEMSPDRAYRKEVFEKYYGRYKEFANTWAALYDGQVKQQIFFAKARKYPSTFEAAVDANNVSPLVCNQLIESVHRNMDKMYRYVALRKKLLGLDELHMYDVYVPMVSDFKMKVTYEETKQTTIEALAPLGDEYVSVLKQAYENRWVDVVENEGKRTGAYSSGVYAVHPYVLMNFNGQLDDIFTLAHEMGHSVHTWYSSKNQSFLNSNYKIFVAEVASTTNEILLLEYLLKKADSKKEKAFLINHYLENFKSTLYRQVMFEEFERKTNAMAEQGIPLTADALSDTYLQLNKLYFGDEMVSDPLIAYEWCRIPHFYYNFYVYQYATSFAASVSIAHRILEEGKPVVDQYLSFLSSGCTEDPVSLLKKAGVDLSTAQPVDEALKVFDRAITDMEELMTK